MDSDYYYDDDPERGWLKVVAAVLLLGALAAGALLLVRAGRVPQPPSDGESGLASGGLAGGGPQDTAGTVDQRGPVAPADSRATSSTEGSNPSTSTSTTQVGTTSSSVGPAASDSTATVVGGSNPGPGYPTGPDGAPLPVVVVFDTATITISGTVPSQAAKDRLAVLAKANSKTDAEVINNLVINDKVPIFVGVRVIELNSVRFPVASADILPEHAAELDRVVNIMNALPKITVLVVGHADQRGSDIDNFAISDLRARAVVNYLLYLGISPNRLSSRAAGESDLLTLDNDEAALALNRRTEFIFYGLVTE